MLCGPFPAPIGDTSSVNWPVLSMRYIETLLLPLLATYANLPSGVVVMACGKLPVAIVGVASAVNWPVALFMLNIETLLLLKLVT